MLNKIKNGLGKVWNGFTWLCDIYNKILFMPFRLVIKLYHWVYDEI